MEGGKKQSGRGKGECEPLNWKEATGRDGHKDTAAITVQGKLWARRLGYFKLMNRALGACVSEGHRSLAETRRRSAAVTVLFPTGAI